jgi:hypothetical protein
VSGVNSVLPSREVSLGERKKQLARLLARVTPGITLNEHTDAAGDLVFRQACAMGLDGIVSKHTAAPSVNCFTLMCRRADLRSARLRSQRSVAMSVEHRLSAEGYRKPSLSALRLSAMNFGLIAVLVLMALAIILTLMFPEFQLQSAEFLVGP